MQRHHLTASPILSYLHDPAVPVALVRAFFRSARRFADAGPWNKLPADEPIALDFSCGEGPTARRPLRRLGLLLADEDAVGLVLADESLDAAPAVSVLFAGYPQPDLGPILWEGAPLPRSRAGLLPWPTVHEPGGLVRGVRPEELTLLVGALELLACFTEDHPGMDDGGALRPHRCELVLSQHDALGDYTHLRASYP